MTTSDNGIDVGLPQLPAFTVPPRKKVEAPVEGGEGGGKSAFPDVKERVNPGLPPRPKARLVPEDEEEEVHGASASALLSRAAVYASAPAPKPVIPYSPANVVEHVNQVDDSNPASKAFLFNLLDDCGDNGVSDLHVHPGVGMWRLTQGVLLKDDAPESVIREEDILLWITHSDGYEKLKLSSPEDLFGTVGHTTVAFGTGKWRVRGSFRRSTVGVSCTFRMIPAKIPTTADVYLPEVLKDMVRRPSGLILIEGPTGSGKGSPVWERILTPTGWTTYGDVCVGDEVVGSDGLPAVVTGVHPRGVLDVFEVTFSDGSSVVVDGDHLWEVQSQERVVGSEGVGSVVLSTSELMDRGVLDAAGSSKWCVPLVEPVRFVGSGVLPVHPYVVGAVLGGGCVVDGSVVSGSVDPAIVDRVRSCVPDGGLPGWLDGAAGAVPSDYLWASVEDRLELLRGLMDTAGRVRGGCVEFSAVSEGLVDGVVFLVQSLGGTAQVSAGCVRVELSAGFNPFWVPCKADVWVGSSVSRGICSVEHVGVEEVVCISVDTVDSLYVADHFIVTHNTTSIAALVDQINTETDQHIYSVEDPIEFHHQPKGNTVFTMREIGVHASNYHSAVENALRSKPNVIFVGEMLDNDTKKAALHAATTGHLVITTAHAGSVAEALDSFIGGFSADEQPQIRGRLSQSLLGVMCQKLIPMKNGKLVAAREVMLNNINFAEIIQNSDTNMLHSQLEGDDASFPLEKDLLRLVQEGIIELDVALNNAKKPKALVEDLVYRGLMVRED